MSTQNTGTHQRDENQSEHGKPNVTDLANCCGPEMFEKAEMRKGCPCAGLMKGSRKPIFAVLAGAGFLFLIVAAGWVLGVVAFFRSS